MLIKVAASVRNRNLRRCMHAGKHKRVGEETTQFGKSSRRFHRHFWSWCLNSKGQHDASCDLCLCQVCTKKSLFCLSLPFKWVLHNAGTFLRREDSFSGLKCDTSFARTALCFSLLSELKDQLGSMRLQFKGWLKNGVLQYWALPFL